MAKRTQQQALIGAATDRLGRAEVELAAALADLPFIHQTDKKMVTARMRTALAEIVAAKADLSQLQGSDGPEDGPDGDHAAPDDEPETPRA